MLVATRTRRPLLPSPPRPEPSSWPVDATMLADALVREHADASSLLGAAPSELRNDLAPVVQRLSREARDVARSLLGDDIAPPVPADAPPVVIERDLAVAQRTLRRALRSRPAPGQCVLLMTSLARVAEWRDIIGTRLEAAGRA